MTVNSKTSAQLHSKVSAMLIQIFDATSFTYKDYKVRRSEVAFLHCCVHCSQIVK